VTLHASEILAGLPPVLTGRLEFCACGHVPGDHVAGRGCQHVNKPSKRFSASARCHCSRFAVHPELADAEVFLTKQMNHVVRKQGLSLEQVERDELLQVMRISLWRASAKFDSRSHIRFGSFASYELYQDAIDEMRHSRMFGRQGQYRLQPLVAHDEDDSWFIDLVDPLENDETPAARLRADRLDRTIPELVVDPPDPGDIDARWAFTDRDREALRTVVVGGRGSREGTAHRARGTAWADGLTALISTKEAA